MMNEEVNNTSAAFMQVTSQKIESQDKRIVAVEEKINNVPDNSAAIQKLTDLVRGLSIDIKNNSLPKQKLTELSATMDNTVEICKQVLKQKVVHHHVPKVIWTAAGLFISLALVSAGWYSTFSKVNDYIANDTKYRQLRLDSANKGLQTYLDVIDSLYDTRNDMRRIVIRKEEINFRNFEQLRRAYNLKAEAKELENEVRKVKR